MKGLDENLQETGLEYIDWWRLTAYENGGEHTLHNSEEIVAALDQAKRQGKARFTGVTSHDHAWLKMMIEQYPAQMDVVLFPYTSDSKVLPQDSLFDTLRKYDVGMLGIKPFGSNSLFKGDGSAGSPSAEEDAKLARMAIRYILQNPGITAPIPGLINVAQVDNMAKAVRERRELDLKESADLRQANQEMWARLPENYQWLKKWEYV
jgi:aryl-alcohol dehydrogenase-like predicted oxidoreductase